VREFRDPIHGFIELEDDEAEVVDSRPFQRLRHISQLALTSYVYHGAEHTRFGHSLGTMYLASLAFERLFERHAGDLGWNEDDRIRRRKTVRLAALLHDVGHAPFSHAGERRLFRQRDGHGHYSREIVRSSEVTDIINRHGAAVGVTAEDVATLLDPSAVMPDQFLRELISGEFGVDRMDYLTRDSLFCGVKYGVFDVSRLIYTLVLKQEEGGGWVLALDEGGLHAAEALLLARYFMFTQVYFHAVRRAYDLDLTDFMSELLQRAYGEQTYPEDVQTYLAWDDLTVWSQAREVATSDSSGAAARILKRQHYLCVYDTGPFPGRDTIFRFRDMPDAVSARFPGIPIVPDAASDHPERYRGTNIYVRRRTPRAPDRWVLFAKESAAVAGLEEMLQMRVYADVRARNELRDEMERWCEAYLPSGSLPAAPEGEGKP
jgi:HD superfamily phosphohydrolase